MPGDAPAAPVARDRAAILGTVLDRKYRVNRIVAEGGFGVVYEGHHLALDTRVAIKVLKEGPARDDDAWADLLAQFLDEAKTLAKLRHPAVVSVLDTGVTHFDGGATGVPWMVLEWLEGQTLADDLLARRRRGGRTPAECMALLRPVLDAIAHAHEIGIVHRDLKPSNVMLVPTARGTIDARVLDFGIAKFVDPEVDIEPTGSTATQSSRVAFTPAYAAPEQLTRTRTGPWTDVFALALILTELLVDATPLADADPTERAAAIFAEQRPTPRLAGVDVGAWEPVLRRALSVRPAERQPNARALLDELDAAMAGARHDSGLAPTVLQESAGARAQRTGDPAVVESTRPAEPARPAPRRVRFAAVAAAIGVTMALAGAATVLRTRSPRDAPSPAPTAAAHECVTNAACIDAHGGEPQVCTAEGRCVPLASQDCEVRAEPDDARRDETLWIGVLAPKSSPSVVDAVELARRDLAAISRVSPTGPGGARRRPIALVVCDGERDPRATTRHLVSDARLPALLGFPVTRSALDLLASEILPHGAITMVTRNIASEITAVPEPAGAPRLVWRTTNSTAQMARAIGALSLASLEPRILRERRHPMKIALVRPRAGGSVGFADALLSSFRFADGSSIPESASRFFELVGESPEHADGGATELDALASFAPDVVVYFGSDYMPWLLALERDPRASPIYVSPLPFDEAALAALPLAKRSLRSRMFALTTPTRTPTNAKFTLHYNATFDEKITPELSENTAYDAVFALAYAAYASGGAGPITGAELARAIPRLLGPGPTIEVGPAQLLEALGALDAGGNIDLQGAATRLDFDPSTGESPTDHVVLCIGSSGDGRPIAVESGLVWDAATGAMRGALRCR